MIPVPDKKNIPKGKIDLLFPIILKIHLQFQQSLPKRYIDSHRACVTFLQKISVCVEKSYLRTKIKERSIHSFKYIFSFQRNFSKTYQPLFEKFSFT